MSAFELLQGDCLQQLATLPAASVHCCVTSPPYWGLRDYGTAGQLGLEATPDEYVANMVAVFRAVRRVLRDDGTLWLNLGDSYAGGPAASGGVQRLGPNGDLNNQRNEIKLIKIGAGIKPKDLVGIPWRVAFALQADGWYLRQDIIWHKPNPMPESVTDRCTKAHEYIFLLTKSARYYYDNEAVKEQQADASAERARYGWNGRRDDGSNGARTGAGIRKMAESGMSMGEAGLIPLDGKRNKRSVWTVATKPFKGAHFATFPPDLIEPCILAGSATKCCAVCGAPWERVVERIAATSKKCPKTDTMYQAQGGTGEKKTGTIGMSGGGRIDGYSNTLGYQPTCKCGGETQPSMVLDPFSGAGTTGVVAVQHGRRYIGIELNPDYLEMSRKRIQLVRDSLTVPMFADA